MYLIYPQLSQDKISSMLAQIAIEIVEKNQILQPPDDQYDILDGLENFTRGTVILLKKNREKLSSFLAESIRWVVFFILKKKQAKISRQ